MLSGPGMGVLTKYLIEREKQIMALDIDKESIAYLQNNMQAANLSIVEGDLKLNLKELFEKIMGDYQNFPYNISSQIVFKVLEFRAVFRIQQYVSKEVAKRICEKPGSKAWYSRCFDPDNTTANIYSRCTLRF